MKIYLCGITHNNYKNIEDLTSVYNHFDGLIFVDGGSTDGTKELLENRKKDGAIIYRNWTNDHDFQMNEFLRQGPMKIGDWFFIRDSRERFNEEWTSNIKHLVKQFETANVQSVYNYGKGFAFKYYDDMFFFGSPHWGLHGARQNSIDLSNFFDENKKEHTWRLKDGEGERLESSFIDHFTKYYYVYGRSNHLLLGRENNQQEFQELETNRQKFRMYCNYLGLDFTLDSLKDFLKKEEWKNDSTFVEMLNKEEILKTFYRWHVLKHDLESITNDMKTWQLNNL
jgi:glycosyltransferase involved in cell wall biosynthesis